MGVHEESDQVLVEMIAEGDERAAIIFVRRHRSRLVVFFRTAGIPAENIDGYVNFSFDRMFQAITGIHRRTGTLQHGTPVGYLISSAKAALVDNHRKLKALKRTHEATAVPLDGVDSLGSTAVSGIPWLSAFSQAAAQGPESILVTAEDGTTRRRLINELLLAVGATSTQQDMFWLRLEEGLEWKAIAAIIGTTPATARKQFERLQSKLKDLVSNSERWRASLHSG